VTDWPITLAELAAKLKISERTCRKWVAATRKLCPGHVFYTGTERKKRFEEHHYELLITCLPAAMKAKREVIGRPRRGTTFRFQPSPEHTARQEAAFRKVRALAKGEPQ
jgi:hypothetical protein